MCDSESPLETSYNIHSVIPQPSFRTWVTLWSLFAPHDRAVSFQDLNEIIVVDRLDRQAGVPYRIAHVDIPIVYLSSLHRPSSNRTHAHINSISHNPTFITTPSRLLAGLVPVSCGGNCRLSSSCIVHRQTAHTHSLSLCVSLSLFSLSFSLFLSLSRLTPGLCMCTHTHASAVGVYVISC